MGLWSKLQVELKKAGEAARDTIDEGKVRLEIFRVRQLADKAAQALGYEVHRARAKGGDLDPETFSRLSSTLAEHEAEAARLAAEIEKLKTGETPTQPKPEEKK